MFHFQPLNQKKCVLLVKQRYIQQFILMLLFFQLQRHFYQVLGSWYTTLLQNPSGSQKWGMCENVKLIFVSFKLGFKSIVSYQLVFRVSKLICFMTLLTTSRIFLQVIYFIIHVIKYFSNKASVHQQLFFSSIYYLWFSTDLWLCDCKEWSTPDHWFCRQWTTSVGYWIHWQFGKSVLNFILSYILLFWHHMLFAVWIQFNSNFKVFKKCLSKNS